MDYAKYKDWKAWVQNRVNCINEVETVWKHVPGSVNLADIATREINLLNISIETMGSKSCQLYKRS